MKMALVSSLEEITGRYLSRRQRTGIPPNKSTKIYFWSVCVPSTFADQESMPSSRLYSREQNIKK